MGLHFFFVAENFAGQPNSKPQWLI